LVTNLIVTSLGCSYPIPDQTITILYTPTVASPRTCAFDISSPILSTNIEASYATQPITAQNPVFSCRHEKGDTCDGSNNNLIGGSSAPVGPPQLNASPAPMDSSRLLGLRAQEPDHSSRSVTVPHPSEMRAVTSMRYHLASGAPDPWCFLFAWLQKLRSWGRWQAI
jgi:hypothetical protein